MTRVTVLNKRRSPVRWGGHTFPARAEIEVDLNDRLLARVGRHRSLRVVAAAKPDYHAQKVDELRALAASRGIEGQAKAKKADVIAALEAADEAGPNDAPDEATPGEGVQGTLERALAEGIVAEAVDPTGVLDARIEDETLILTYEGDEIVTLPEA